MEMNKDFEQGAQTIETFQLPLVNMPEGGELVYLEKVLILWIALP